MMNKDCIAIQFMESLPSYTYRTRYEPDAIDIDNVVFVVDMHKDFNINQVIIKFSPNGLVPICLIHLVEGELLVADYIRHMELDWRGIWMVDLEDMGTYQVSYDDNWGIRCVKYWDD